MDISLKRIIAYIIDVLIVTIIMIPFIRLKAINPYIDEYNKYYEEYTELVNDEDADIKSDEYKDRIIELNYKLGEYKQVNSSLSVVGIIIYFVIVQYFLKGQTIGKKILNIRIVSNKDKKLNIGHDFIRTVILNNIIFSLLLIFGIYLFNAEGYYVLSLVVSYLQLLVISVIVLMVVLRKDNRGLHDILVGTKVISINVTNEEDVEIKTIENKEIIEEKEVIKNNTKNSSKKTTSKANNKNSSNKTKKMTSTKKSKKL